MSGLNDRLSTALAIMHGIARRGLTRCWHSRRRPWGFYAMLAPQLFPDYPLFRAVRERDLLVAQEDGRIAVFEHPAKG